MYSYPSTNNNIQNAKVNQGGTVKWQGSEKTILESLNEGIRDRGVIMIPLDANGDPDTVTLGGLGSNDARIAIVVGLGVFMFDANSIPPIPSSAIMGTNGLWRLVSETVSPAVTKAFGAGGLSCPVPHGLKTTTPTVLVFQQSASTTGLPYVDVTKDVTISVVDADNITVTFPATTTLVHNIVVKP